MVNQVSPQRSLGVLTTKAFQLSVHAKSHECICVPINKMAKQFATNTFSFSEAWEKNSVFLELQILGLLSPLFPIAKHPRRLLTAGTVAFL